MFGALIRKIFVVMRLLNRVHISVRSQKDGKKRHRRWSFLSVIICVLIDLIVLLPWTFISPITPQTRRFLVPHIGTVYITDYTCSGENATQYMLILIAYKAFLTLIGVSFAFKTTSLDTAIGESTMMMYSTYNLLVCGLLGLTLTFVRSVAFAHWLVIASSISCFAILFSLNILFIPKMYLYFTNTLSNSHYICDQGDNLSLSNIIESKAEISKEADEDEDEDEEMVTDKAQHKDESDIHKKSSNSCFIMSPMEAISETGEECMNSSHDKMDTKSCDEHQIETSMFYSIGRDSKESLDLSSSPKDYGCSIERRVNFSV